MSSRKLLLQRFVRFAGVGLAATAVHAAIAWLLLAPVGPYLANAAGFLVALAITYAGNYFYTFRSTADHKETVIRFLVVSAATIAVSQWVLVGFAMMGANQRAALLLAVGVIPVLRFSALAGQVFLDQPSEQSLGQWLLNVAVWFGAAAMGLAALVAFAPNGFLDPDSALWRLPAGDRGNAVAGMRYYLADEWHWPLLLTDDLRAPEGTIVAFTDSIPIMALLAKLARPLIGSDINYLPTWYLIIYTLQGPSAVAALRSLGVRRPVSLLAGAAIAVSSPAFVIRPFHPALTAHFIILLILAASLTAGRRRPAVTFSLVGLGLTVALLIHPYLMLMSLPFVVAIMVDKWRQGAISFPTVTTGGLCVAAALLLTLFAGGYLGTYQSAEGYGMYGMNLLGPIWPEASGLAPGDEATANFRGNRTERFNWLGFGTLAVVVVALIVERRGLLGLVRRWNALLVATVVVTVVSISHVINIGPNTTLDLTDRLAAVEASSLRIGLIAAVGLMLCVGWLWWRKPRGVPTPLTLAVGWLLLVAGLIIGPTRGSEILSPVRASGRLWWAVGLITILAAVAIVDRRRTRWSPAFLALAALVQVVDVGPVRDFAATAVTGTSLINGSDLLIQMSEEADVVRVAPDFFCAPFPDGTFAVLDTIVATSVAGTPIDTAYTARRPAGIDCSISRIQPPGPGELLVLVPPARRDPGSLLTPSLSCRDDGFLMLCSEKWAGLDSGATPPFRPVIAEPLTFGLGGDAGPRLGDGWPAEPEPWGMEVSSAGANLTVPLVIEPKGQVALSLRVRHLGEEPAELVVSIPGSPAQTISVPPGPDRNVELVFGSVIGKELEVSLYAGAGQAGVVLLRVLAVD